MNEHEEDRLLEAGEAAKYLADKWGIPNYSTDAFKQLRRRHRIQPAILAGNASLWRKSDLDAIPMPGRGRPRKKNGGEEGCGLSVTPHHEQGLTACSVAA